MQTIQDSIDDLNRCAVTIQEAGSSAKVLGTGVVVTNDGLILTCYHVVGDIKNKNIKHGSIDVYFPESKITKSAQVIKEYSDPSIDIAFFKIEDGLLPEKAVVSRLGVSIFFGHKFASIGFRKPQVFEKLSSTGEIRIKTSFKTRDGIESPSLIQLYSDEIEPGMSGAPVLDLDTNRVVGIISEHWITAGNVDAKLNFAIPIESIVKTYTDLKQLNPGLKPIFDFVRKIGQEGTRKYEKIDELYVPPTNYDEIKKSLEEYRILFLTGTQEYGKTYTAVYLLWEYYKNKGYEPVWFKGAEEKEDRRDVRKKFVNVEKYLKPNSIIYFEDPFGKTEYEVTTDEVEITRNIATIIETVENTDDTYVIITSREEVFKEFQRKITGKVELRKYEKKLGVKTPSYNYEKRKEMLFRWANIMNSKWNEDEDLKNTVFEAIEDESKLPTPLNIEQFAISTAKKVLDKDKLLEKINAKSIETAKGFAEEIKMMSSDKILFLSFPFISEYFSAEFVKENYQKLLKELEIEQKQTARQFDKILEWFRGDKIDVSYNVIRFSHPSYSEALPYILVDNDGVPTNLNAEIFSNVLLKLSALDDDAALDVTNIIYDNFDKLPDHVREELLIKLAHNEIDRVAENVARIIANNYDKLPDRLKNLLIELADVKGVGIDIAYAVAKNADKLPANVRNLLSKIAIDNGAPQYVEDAISRNFDKFPQDNVTKELFVKLADNKVTTIYAANIAAKNFSRLPANIMNELLKELVPKFLTHSGYPHHNDLPWCVYKILLDNFVSLSNDLKQLLYRIIDEKYGRLNGEEIIVLLIDNFEKYPRDTRNELLSKFENSFGLHKIVEAIPDVLDTVSEDILDELILRLVNRGLNERQSYFLENADLYSRLSDNAKSELLYRFVNENRFSMGFMKENIYDKLSDNAKNELLYRFVNENRFTMEFISYILIEYYDNLPNDLAKELMSRLINQYDNRLHLALIIIKNHEKVDYDILTITNILYNLGLDDSYSVSKALLHYFDILPVELKELLFKFADDKKTAKGICDLLQEEEEPFSDTWGSIGSQISQNVSNELINELIIIANKTLTYPSRRKNS